MQDNAHTTMCVGNATGSDLDTEGEREKMQGEEIWRRILYDH